MQAVMKVLYLSVFGAAAAWADALVEIKDLHVRIGENQEKFYYAGSNVRLPDLVSGQKVEWKLEKVGEGDGLIEFIPQKGMLRVTRGSANTPSATYLLTANLDQGKEKRRLKLRVLGPQLKVMTWNIWGKEGHKSATQPIEPKGWEHNFTYGYEYEGRLTGQRERVVEIINKSGADIVALQESYGQIRFLTENTALKHHFGGEGRGDNIAILSRYPLVEKMTLGSNFNYLGSEVALSEHRKFRMFSSWFASSGSDWPIFHEKVTDAAGVKMDERQRLPSAKKLTEFIRGRGFMEAVDEVPVIVAGDHNAISHLDYTSATRGKDQNYKRGEIAAPVSLHFESEGFVDGYRAIYPSSLTHPCMSYSPVYLQNKQPLKEGMYPLDKWHVRIDYVYAQGKKLLPVEAQIIESFDSKVVEYPKFKANGALSQRGTYVFPSDHAAVMVTYEWID
jgi:endonuclease/exonuclease/phosphatase family metal-dependent hydrolase